MKNLIEDIKIEEGFRGDPYNDHLGYPTVGYGKTKEKNKQLKENGRLFQPLLSLFAIILVNCYKNL